MFDAKSELGKLRETRDALRRKRYRFSKLRVVRAELVALRREAASYRELAFWLRKEKDMIVDPTTIRRFLVQLPELSENG